jgi:mono/diheme cytochrome c family protein
VNKPEIAHTETRRLIILLLVLFPCFASAQDYDGAQLYAANCSNCHGLYGEGDGPVTPELSVVLLDLRYLSERNDGEFPHEFARQVIDGRELRVAHGPAGMPVWGVEFSKSEGYGDEAQQRVAAKVDALAAFLEQIQISE